MMFAHYVWGCRNPRWACVGPTVDHCGRRWHYESRRSAGLRDYRLLFGVRRPLRYMGYHLDLDDDQLARLADILNRLKTERAQAALDWEWSVAAIATAMDSEDFDDQAVEGALKMRVESAMRLRDEVIEALRKTHQMLEPDQRSRLAYLLRSGQLTI